MSTSSELCPCGSGVEYPACCGRWHAGEPAPTPEALMRSRYTAFVLANEPYLLATWHPRTRPKSVPFEPDTAWLGLKVVGTRDVAPDKAEVEFIARFRVGDSPDGRIHERSRFVREDGCWLYLDGQFRAPEGDRSPREGGRPPRDRGRPPRSR